MRIRVRGPNGVSTITLDSTATVADLKSSIADKTQLATFDLKRGYPPKELELDSLDASLKLAESGLGLDGEQIIALRRAEDSKPTSPEPTKAAPPAPASAPAPTATPLQPASVPPPPQQPTQSDPPEIPLPTHGSTLLLRVMPDDNSCLFRAFGSAYGIDDMPSLRSVIASTILADTSRFNAGILDGKAPASYASWIQRTDSWGGDVELSVLSEHFGVQIASISVKDGRVDVFNEGAGDRVILVYSGIHYDTVALSPSEPPHTKADLDSSFDVRLFSSQDDVILQGALDLCKELRARRYYTDTAGFVVVCGDCGWEGRGEKEATKHAKETGHYNFGEAEG